MKTKLLFLFMGLIALTATAQHETYWENQNSNFPDASTGIRDISVVNDQVAWALGYDGSGGGANYQIFTKTTDGGATWTSGTIDIGSSGSGIAMITGVSETTAWIVAFPNNSGDAQGIYKTTDGGATWVRQDSAHYDTDSAFSNVVYFWDENVGVCQGDPVDGYFEIYTTTDGGDNWTRVPEANIPAIEGGEYGYTSQIFVTGNTVWFTTNHGRIFRSYDQGHNWEAFQSPISDFGSAASNGEISFSDDNNGYLINQDGTFWKSSDGGETWDITFPDSGLIFGGNIFAIPGTNAVYNTGAGDLKGSSYSFDGGLNWVVMCDDQHLDIRFTADGLTGYSGGFNGGDDGSDPTVGGMFKYIGPTVSLPELQAKGFVVYPNPVQDVLHLGANEAISHISIYNILGQEVLSQNINATTASIDTSDLAKGTYIANITIGNASGSIKIVK